MNYDRGNLRWNGWGWNNKTYKFSGNEEDVWAYLKDMLGMKALPETPSVTLEEVELSESRLSVGQQEKLSEIVGELHLKLDRFERVFHAKGKSYHDLVRVRLGQIGKAPDAVVYPQNVHQIKELMKFAEENKCVLVPFGGGSSVVGGVDTDYPNRPVITIDMTHMKALISLDQNSLTATFETGIYGPELEAELNQKGYTLSHYPQSFEFSTLGGWIAARGAGQQSDRYGKAETFLKAARLITPTGELVTWSLPASAAGPDLNQLIAGSEGILGVIAEATVRIHPLPEAMDYRGFLFPNFKTGAAAVKEMFQQGIPLAMLRLSDEDETNALMKLRGGGGGGIAKKLIKKWLAFKGIHEKPALMLFGFEGSANGIIPPIQAAKRICKKYGGVHVGAKPGRHWYETRFEAPYLRDPLMDHGIGVDTLETAVSWSNLAKLHQDVKQALAEAMHSKEQHGYVMAHISHSYHVGACVYFTFLFPIEGGREVSQWEQLKRAASNAIAANHGTISHHHGVGVDHRPWFEAEKSALGIKLLRGAKHEVDPNGIMNPGKLLREA